MGEVYLLCIGCIVFQDRIILDETFSPDVENFNESMLILHNITAIQSTVTLAAESIQMSNCRFINSSLLLMADNMTLHDVHITESLFTEGSTISIQHVTLVTINATLLETAVHELMMGQPTHILQIKHADSLNMANVTFVSEVEHINLNEFHTDGGLWLENVTHARILDSTFRNIAMLRNGSVVMLVKSSVELDSCEFTSNQGLNGIIYAGESVVIFSKNSTYRSNHVTGQGGVYHITTANKLVNINRYGAKLFYFHISNQHTFNTIVGGKLLGPTILGSPTVGIVGVGVTFSLLLWKYCWTYKFWPPTVKTKIVGPTKDVKVAPTNG